MLESEYQVDFNKGLATLQRVDLIERRLDDAITQLIDMSYKLKTKTLKDQLLFILGQLKVLYMIVSPFLGSMEVPATQYDPKTRKLITTKMSRMRAIRLRINEYIRLVNMIEGGDKLPTELTTGDYHYLRVQDLYESMIMSLSLNNLEIPMQRRTTKQQALDEL